MSTTSSRSNVAGSASGSRPSGSGSGAAPEYSASSPRPTESSYYDFRGTPSNRYDENSPTWMYAREARAQVLASPNRPGRGGYPRYFNNHPQEATGERLPLRVNRPVLHHPLIPGQLNPWRRQQPGAVRSFYHGRNRRVFDVGYHDPNAGVSRGGQAEFSLAPYIPAARPPLPQPPQQTQRTQHQQQAQNTQANKGQQVQNVNNRYKT